VRPLPALAAAAAAAAVTAGALLFAFHDDRRAADQYREALATAHGSYFDAVPLRDPADRAGGVVFRYSGKPSWILLTVAPQYRGSVRQAELITRDGKRIPLAAFRLANGTWGGSLPVGLDDVAAVHLIAEDGRSVLVAPF
jgi:hypothetical protein